LNFNFKVGQNIKLPTGQTYSCVANFLDIPLTQVMYKGKAVIVEGGIDSNGRGTFDFGRMLNAS
jgi:agmatine deiminase